MNINRINKVFREKGTAETLIYGIKLSSDKILSRVKILFLKLRGYDIHDSVLLRGHNFFFQSTKNAIKISSNSVIGQYTRISGGGKGKVLIGESVLIDDYTFIMAHEKIEIGKNSKIAAFCFITDFNHKFQNTKMTLVSQGYETKPVTIGENVWIGTHSIILPGVSIGDRVVIGAGSVVTHDIPSHAVAVGNPAKVVKRING